jgi:hypothetical protein
MADQKVTALVEETAPLTTDILYIVDDPAGVPVSKKVTVLNAFDAGLKSVQGGTNLIKNSPGQIAVDGAEPQWWDDVANATITDEDTAGEGIPDIYERCFKVVTIANDVYGYQTFTFADEALLDAGTTEVSLSCWVYCATGNKASIGIQGTNLGLQESSQAGAGAWELLTVENITLNAADASIQVRFIVDTDTAWFTMPMLNVGALAMPWQPRGQKYVPTTQIDHLDLNTTGDVAWTDTDCTANTDPLATAIQVYLTIKEADGLIGSWGGVGHSDTITGADVYVVQAKEFIINQTIPANGGPIFCDDSQVIRYVVGEADADNDVRFRIYITGYWMWD